MKLITKYFNFIKDGTKRIELRLNDEKRRNFKIGDKIIFTEINEIPKTIETKIVDLYYEDNFEKLIDRFDMQVLASKDTTKEELLNVLNEIYTKGEQREYGVVGIKIELIENKD